jgi:hypothetical protein
MIGGHAGPDSRAESGARDRDFGSALFQLRSVRAKSRTAGNHVSTALDTNGPELLVS